MRCCLPSLRPAAFPPPSPPPISVSFVRCFNGTTQPSDSSSVPRQLRLLDFLSRPGIAQATAGQTRSPRFRRDPSVRDVASDPGRATVPRITAPHILPSAVATASAPAISRISWLNPTPQTITVYASPWSSPSTTQHSLPGGRYPFPGPDFHLRAIEHARHTTNPLPREWGERIGEGVLSERIVVVEAQPSGQEPTSQRNVQSQPIRDRLSAIRDGLSVRNLDRSMHD